MNEIYLNEQNSLLQIYNDKGSLGKVSIYRNDNNTFVKFESSSNQNFDIKLCNVENSSFTFNIKESSTITLKNSKDSKYSLVFDIPTTNYNLNFQILDSDATELLEALNKLIKDHIITQSSDFTYKITKNIPNEKSLGLLYYAIVHNAVCSKIESSLAPILSKRKIPISLEQFTNLFDEKGVIHHFQELKSEIYFSGVEDEARPYIWLYLFGYYDPLNTTEENKKKVKDQYEKYKIILQQIEQIPEQKKFAYSVDIISNDVKRTDSGTEMFNKENSPAHKLLETVLRCYSIYNSSTGFVQGMGDYASVFMRVYFKEIQQESVVLFNGEILPNSEAQSMIFWNLVNCFKLSNHDIIFKELSAEQNHLAQRVFYVIASIHPSLKQFLINFNFKELIIIYRYFLLQMKREFPKYVYRLWDTFYSSDCPYTFIVFFTSALLILSFPTILAENYYDIGEVMSALDKFTNKSDPMKMLDYSLYFCDLFSKNNDSDVWIFLHRAPRKPQKQLSQLFKQLQEMDFDNF